MLNLVVEGWRFLPHSYSIVNQFQCLEFLKRRDRVNLFHRDVAYYNPNWQMLEGIFRVEDENKLRNITQPKQDGDVTFRIKYPYNLAPAQSKKTFVFATSEMLAVPPFMLENGKSLEENHKDSDVVIITPSQWSKRGFLNSGADPDRVVVIPHGVDPQIYYPVESKKRSKLRNDLGWDESFIFLNISSMLVCKGIDILLKAFAQVVENYPQTKLVLKGLDSLYYSQNILEDILENLTFGELENILPRLSYIGDSLSFVEIAQLYQGADVYVSPYLSEGFNMPVLEALACGLPVICTKGGPTDDFTNPDFALNIESQLGYMDFLEGFEDSLALKPDLGHLVELMIKSIEDEDFRQQAKSNAAKFVAESFTYEKVVDRLLILFGDNHI
jgi:glycosyltransferase involved in cell wall biosynthesis